MTGPIFKDSKTENTVTLSLQVLYTTENGTTFDHAYYTSKHLPIVTVHMCSHIQEILIIKGLAGGPDTPSGYHVIATMTFADKAALDSAMAARARRWKIFQTFTPVSLRSSSPRSLSNEDQTIVWPRLFITPKALAKFKVCCHGRFLSLQEDSVSSPAKCAG